MDIVQYSQQYETEVSRLIQNFSLEAVSEYEGIYNSEAIIQTIKNADHSNAFLMLIDGFVQGILYGVCMTAPTTGKMVFQEVMWYVNEPFRRHGVRLLNEVEKILKSRGVSIMIMAVLENSKTEKLKDFYERLGFKKIETHYMRAT